MKKLFFLLGLTLFCVGALVTQSFAAPQNNVRGGGLSTKKTATKATKKTRKSTKQAAIDAAERVRGKQRTYGLMPSELNRFNQSVYHADAEAIKGARDTESALRYIPFITIVNTAGFGQQFDLRGQGRLSANGLKFAINGVNVAPLDSYYGFMPINTVLPSLIQEVQVFPGQGARGGAINVITSKRQNPYFVVGAGYLNTTGNTSFNAFAQASDKINRDISVNAGVAYSQMGGPREDDKQTGIEGVLGADYQLGLGQKVHFDADFFTGKTKTTPYNSFLDADRIMNEVMNNTDNYCKAGVDEPGICQGGNGATQTINGQQVGGQKWAQIYKQIEALPFYEPSKDDRGTKGDGIIESSQMRLVTTLGFEAQPTSRMLWDITGFVALDKRKLNTHEIYLPYYGYLSLTGSERWTPELAIVEQYGKKYGYHYIEQSGSTFDENKFGGRLKAVFNHDSGLFAFGVDSTYEMGRRKPIQILRGAVAIPPNPDMNTEATINNELNIDKFTNALWLRENYYFNSSFSLMGGFRYEMINYKIKSHDNIIIDTYALTSFDAEKTYPTSKNDLVYGKGTTDITKEFKKNYDTFTFELAPAFRYSNTGVIYGHFETGYSTPPGYALLVRGINKANPNAVKRYTDATTGGVQGEIIYDDYGNPRLNLAADNLFTLEENSMEQETYISYEIGFKDLIGTRVVPLGFTDFNINAILFAASVFYTTSKNEFYFTGDPYSQMSYGTYDKSRRMGVEVALEQYIFGGALGFNESFTYLKAERFSEMNGENKWNQIPYTYDYKATFGGNVNVAGMVEIVDVSVNLWIQNSLYGKQRVVAAEYANGKVFEVEKKLDPYIISDLGLSVGFNKEMGVVTVGVKNVFDTFYYDYYNADRSASINENRYLIGRGRTVFLEGTFRY